MKNCCVVLRYGSNAIFLGSVEATDVNVSSNITSYPIYSGDTVGEHMIREPITVSLRGSYAVNGSDGILINNDVPSLKRFQQEMEALRDNGTLCDYYKIAYNPSDPRFVKRTGMALKNISWVEHFNSLEFSLSFQQVFVASVASGPSIYAGQSNYSNGSEQMPGSYNPNTGVVTDLPTGQTANTSRAPGEVSYDDFGITEKNDEYIPDYSEPYSSNFIETYLKKEDVIASIIGLCCDEGIVEEAFVNYMNDPRLRAGKIIGGAGLIMSATVFVGALGKTAAAIGAAKTAVAAATTGLAKAGAIITGIGSVGCPIAAAVLAAVAAGVFLAILIKSIHDQNQIDERKNKFKKSVFALSKKPLLAGEAENDETARRFVGFCEGIYRAMLAYDDKFLTYEITSTQDHQAVLTFNGVTVNLDINNVWDEKIQVKAKTSDGGTYLVGDLASSAKIDYGDCTNTNYDFKVTDGNTTYYGYFLYRNRAYGELSKNQVQANNQFAIADPFSAPAIPKSQGQKPTDFVIAVSSMSPSNFADALASTVSNYIYTNYQDVIGEG